MNYYEELGLTGSASVEEIRQAYKSLARLLHPDQQRDEQLRRVAELQMMRLNEIVEVLSDPVRREKYDASLAPADPVASAVIGPEMAPWKRIHFKRFRIRAGAIAWAASLVLGAVGFSFALLYFEQGSSIPVYEGPSQRSCPAQATAPGTPADKESSAAQPAGQRGKKGTLQTNKKHSPGTIVAPIPSEPRQEPPQAAQVSAATAPPVPSEETRTSPKIPAAADVSSPAAPPPPSAVKHNDSSPGPLVGTWLFSNVSTDSVASSGSAYRPEYIEMVVKPAASGTISGRYLGRFHVPDQAVSSEVGFVFEGAVGQGTTVLPWRNSDGAQGQVRMRIVSEGAVEVSWYTTHFGSSRKLASGTAVLRRD